MANIKITAPAPLYDGMAVLFKAPCDCTAVNGLAVSYGNTEKLFTFKDAHGNTLTSTGNLFTKGAIVKALLDIVNGFAYLQNADTNAYLEGELSKKYSPQNKPTLKALGAAPQNHDHGNQLIAPAAIDLRPGADAGHGGYVDFNYNNSAQDYTTRLIEHNAGHLYMNVAGSPDNYPLHTGRNKPNGSYTGNGDAASRDILTGGIGTCVVVWNQYGVAIVTGNGAIVCDASTGSVTFLDASKANCENGTIKLSTDNKCLNASGAEHWYQVL